MKTICGLDEVGRGALAGPLVAAAVVVDLDLERKLNESGLVIGDSKQMTEVQRNRCADMVENLKMVVEIEVISSLRINNRGIGWVNREIFRQLIKKVDADEYIVDGRMKLGRVVGKTDQIRSVIGADGQILPVMLAGIVAKVKRDKMMRELHHDFPVYNWKNNVGYGTKRHLKALDKHGMTRFHRSVFVTTAMRKWELK